MMNGGIRLMRRPRRAWPSAARTAAAITAAALALLAAACGGSPSSTGSGGSSNAGASATSQSTSPSVLAFSQCMRSHDVPNFPDPDASGNGKFPNAQQLRVSSSLYQTAENACQHLLPVGANDRFPAAEVQQLLIGMREFSQCMRSHGVPNWPDPAVNSGGQPLFPLSENGFTRGEAHSPQITSVEQQCSHLLPSALGGTPIG